MASGSCFPICAPARGWSFSAPPPRPRGLEGFRVFDLMAGPKRFCAATPSLTAEGALFAAMRAQEKALRDCDCLVIGWGRIGRALTEMLVALGARATVASRAERSRRRRRSAARSRGDPRPRAISECKRLVFSTPPFPVLQEAELARAGRDACIIDLSSPPYGVDVEAAHRLGLRAWREPGLPGRYCPESAALAIAAAFEKLRKGGNEDA